MTHPVPSPDTRSLPAPGAGGRPRGPGRTRVVQVLGSSAGGVARHVAQASELLAVRPDVDVLVVGPESVRPLVGAVPGAGFSVVEIADRPRLDDLAAVLALRAVARTADVVHAHGLRAGALAVLAVRSLPRRWQPQVVVTLHNLPVGSRAVLLVSGVLEGVVGHGADVVLGVSGDLVRRAQARGARTAERALVPAPPTRTPGERGAVRDALGVAEDDALLVTVGRLAPQKDLGTLCSAAGILAAAGRPLLWAVAGGGPLQDGTQGRIDSEQLPVRLLGPRDDAVDLMAAADIVVSTALWEGQPLGVQEALRVGAAVVATDAGGTSEVTGDAAALVPVGDAEALAAAVLRLLDDPQALSSLRSRAVERAAELPTVDDLVDQLLRLYTLNGAVR